MTENNTNGGDNVGQDKISADMGDNTSDVSVGKDIQHVHTYDVNAPILQAQGNIENIGRDKIINIVIVGQLLEFAQVKGLLPQIKGKDFSTIAEAVEDTLNTRLDSDLADAVAFAGEILGDLLGKTTANYSSSPSLLRHLVKSMPTDIRNKLKLLGYWDAYSQRFNGRNKSLEESAYESLSSLKIQIPDPTRVTKNSISMLSNGKLVERVLWLSTTNALFERHFHKQLDMCIYTINNYSWFCSSVENNRKIIEGLSSEDFNSEELRVIITGVVLDLIRLKSEDKISYQFLQEMADMFNRHKPTSE